MKILHVISTFPPAYAFGGPPKVAFDVCRELVRRGHDVEVYATNAYDQKSNFNPISRRIYVEGIKVTYFPNLLKIANLFVAPTLISKLIKTIDSFHVLHIHFGRQLYDTYVGFSRNLHETPYILQAHGSIPHIGKRRILKLLYDKTIGWKTLSNASKVIALTRVEAEQYRSVCVPEEKIAIVPNGIDLSEYDELPPKGSFRKKFNIPEDRKIILYLGRIHKIKGIDFLIRAYAHLRNEMKFKDAILVIAGPDDGYLEEAKSLTGMLGISKHVLFTGPLYGRDKLEAYIDSEFYVLSSRYETFPMAILEAYACSKPVIASNVGRLRDLVVDGRTGLLFEAGNFRQLAEKMFYLLNDEAKSVEMGGEARDCVKEKYSIGRVVDMIEELYRDVVRAY
jgi:glycosyltransferase involved in cell wall biosynthesis